MKLDVLNKPYIPLAVWWVGSGLLVSVLWVLSLILQLDVLHSAQLWYGLWATYLLPGIGLSFALQMKKVDWLERVGWIIGSALVVIPSLLFGLTAAGLPFVPVMQVSVGLGGSLLSGAVYVIRVYYGK